MSDRLAEQITVFISYFLLLLTFPISIIFCFKVVTDYQRAVIFRLGRLRPEGTYGPGLIFLLPCVDEFSVIDLRTSILDILPQEVLSKDSVTVTVDAVVYYFIFNPLDAVIKIHDYEYSTALLGATILRNVLGTKVLCEILTDRKALAQAIQSILDEATDPWGVKVERVEITDVKLPVQMQRAMATEAETSREARAKVIAADGELRASRALKEASDIIMQSPATLQLRYLQTLNTITSEKSSKIIFPVPIDFLPPKMMKK